MFVPIRRDPITFREKSFSDASALQKNVRRFLWNKRLNCAWKFLKKSIFGQVNNRQQTSMRTTDRSGSILIYQQKQLLKLQSPWFRYSLIVLLFFLRRFISIAWLIALERARNSQVSQISLGVVVCLWWERV